MSSPKRRSAFPATIVNKMLCKAHGQRGCGLPGHTRPAPVGADPDAVGSLWAPASPSAQASPHSAGSPTWSDGTCTAAIFTRAPPAFLAAIMHPNKELTHPTLLNILY